MQIKRSENFPLSTGIQVIYNLLKNWKISMKSNYLFIALIYFLSMKGFSFEVKVGIAELDYPPYYYMNKNKMIGLSYEIANEVAKIADIKLNYMRFPWKRVLRNLEIGQIDMLIHSFKTDERAQYSIYTDTPHVNESSYIFVHKDSNIQRYKQDLSNFNDRPVGHVRGYYHGKAFESNSKIKKMDVVNENQLVKMIIGKRFDAGIGNKAAIILAAKDGDSHENIRFLQPVLFQEPCFFAISKTIANAKLLKHKLDTALKSFMNTTEYRNLLIKYNH